MPFSLFSKKCTHESEKCIPVLVSFSQKLPSESIFEKNISSLDGVTAISQEISNVSSDDDILWFNQEIEVFKPRLKNIARSIIANKKALGFEDEMISPFSLFASKEDSSICVNDVVYIVGVLVKAFDIASRECSQEYLNKCMQNNDKKIIISSLSLAIQVAVSAIKEQYAKYKDSISDIPQLETISEDIVFSEEEVAVIHYMINKTIDSISKMNILIHNLLSDWQKYTKSSNKEIAAELRVQCEAIKDSLRSRLIKLSSMTEVKSTSFVNDSVGECVKNIDFLNCVFDGKFNKIPVDTFLNDQTVKYSIALTMKRVSILENRLFGLNKKFSELLVPAYTKIYKSIYQKWQNFSTNTAAGKFVSKFLTAKNVIWGALYYNMYRFIKSGRDTLAIEKNASFVDKIATAQLGFVHLLSQTLGQLSLNIPKYLFSDSTKSAREVMPFATDATLAALFTSVMSYWESKLDEQLGYRTELEKAKGVIHNYLMNDDGEGAVFGNKKYSDHDLYSPLFDNLREKGVIQPLLNMCRSIEDPHSQDNRKEQPRTFIVTGASGCGKTYLVQATLQTLLNKGISVRPIELSPKRFAVDSKKQDEPDLFEIIMAHVQSNSEEVVVIYLDEFHYFFYDKNGQPSPDRIAGFLQLFTDICTKQKNNRGGLYIIASTDRPDLVPYAIFTNPSRVADAIHIKFPNHSERLVQMYKQLTMMGIDPKTIDLEIISQLLEGNEVSQGRIAQIINLALDKARYEHKVLTTNHLYDSINAIIRRVDKDLSGTTDKVKRSLATYYSAISAVSLLLDESVHFDSATIYGIKQKSKRSLSHDLLSLPEFQSMTYGALFTHDEDGGVDLISKNKVFVQCVTLLAGNVYCEVHNCPRPPQAQEDREKAFKIAYKLFDPAIPQDLMNKKLKSEAVMKTIAFIKQCEEKLTALFGVYEYSFAVQKITELLFEKKFITSIDCAGVLTKGDVKVRQILSIF